MKITLALFTAAVACASNSVTITELTGSTQTGRPMSVSRMFSQGEIAGYAQPSISGTPLTTWQCDAKSRWGDGTLKHAIISFAQSFTGNQVVVVSFVNNVNPSSAGNLTATNAASLTQTTMLSFDPGTGASTWGAEIQATQGATQTANVRTMLGAGNWRYWLRGPVVTQAIVEDRSGRTYDFGWQCTAGCTSAYSSATWITAPSATYRSLHPMFIVTFYSGWFGVKIESVLENSWADRLQDEYYSLVIKTHSDLSVTKETDSAVGHNAGTRWRRVYWDGSVPQKVNLDINLPYLVASRALPNYDTSRVVGCCGVNTAGGLEIADFKAHMADSGASFGLGTVENELDIRETGQWTIYTPSSGGRGEIGPIPRWDARWLYAQNDSLYRVMMGNAIAAANTTPIHIREHRTDNKYLSTAVEPGQTTLAQGHALSVDARPTGWLGNRATGTGSDPITLVGITKCIADGTAICSATFDSDPNANSWTFDQAHQSQMFYAAYLATGDYFWYEELAFLASFAIYDKDPGTCYYCRSRFTWRNQRMASQHPRRRLAVPECDDRGIHRA
jgi:hypothetical protein